MSNSNWVRFGIMLTTMWMSATVSFTAYETMYSTRETCCYGSHRLKLLRCEAATTPAATPWDKAADSQNTPRWAARILQPDYQAFDGAQHSRALNQYWESVVAPTVSESERPTLRERFFAADGDCALAIDVRIKIVTVLLVMLLPPLLGWGIGFSLLKNRKNPAPEKMPPKEQLPSAMKLDQDD